MTEAAPANIVQELHEFTVVKATPQTLMGVWGYVRRGLVKVQKNMAGGTWTPEQIKRDIVLAFMGQGSVELYTCHRGERVVGFYVLVPSFDQFQQLSNALTVWIMYASEPGVLDACASPIEKLARERGYAAIDFITSQQSVAKKAEKHGYKRLQVLCRKELEY